LTVSVRRAIRAELEWALHNINLDDALGLKQASCDLKF